MTNRRYMKKKHEGKLHSQHPSHTFSSPTSFTLQDPREPTCGACAYDDLWRELWKVLHNDEHGSELRLLIHSFLFPYDVPHARRNSFHDALLGWCAAE